MTEQTSDGSSEGAGTAPEAVEESTAAARDNLGKFEGRSVGPRAPQDTAIKPTKPGISWYRDRLLLATVFAVLIMDQASKYLVRITLSIHESWPETGFVRLTHGTNTGAAFGFLPNATLFLIVASFFAIGFIYYFYRTQALPHRLLRLAIGLQLGGAFGNLIDRIRVGAVVDFIDVGPWPVFNLADSSIVVGVTILVLTLILTRDARPADEDADRRTGSEE